MAEKDQVASVAIKIPLPWLNDMKMWLHVVDSQFMTRGITQEITKFHHVVAALTPDLASRLRHIIFNPPAENPYTGLCKEIIKQTSLSDQQRYTALLRDVELGDSRPPQLLQRLETMAGDKITDRGFLRQIFIEKLPPMVQVILAAAPSSSSLSELSELADKIAEACSLQPSISAVQHAPSTSPHGNTLQQVLETQRLVQEELRSLQAELRSSNRERSLRRERSQSRGRNRSQGRSSSRNDSDTGLCWYHRVWGNLAKNCREPCTQAGNGPARK